MRTPGPVVPVRTGRPASLPLPTSSPVAKPAEGLSAPGSKALHPCPESVGGMTL
jgi:hypothetical protein